MKKSILVPYDQYLALKGCGVAAVKEDSNPIAQDSETPDQSSDRLSTEFILSLLPLSTRRKSEALLNFIETVPAVCWNNDGAICINNNRIENSHICDIIHFATSKTKTPPKGSLEVFNSLTNIPLSLIPNPNAKILFGGKATVPPGKPDKFRNLNDWKLSWKEL